MEAAQPKRLSAERKHCPAEVLSLKISCRKEGEIKTFSSPEGTPGEFALCKFPSNDDQRKFTGEVITEENLGHQGQRTGRVKMWVNIMNSPFPLEEITLDS